MITNISIQLAGIVGPVLIAVSSSEYINFKIWEKAAPALVYLNGLLLFTGGLLVVRFHNDWTPQWPLTVTLAGWLLLLAGAFRMFFPNKQQAQKGWQTNMLILVIFILGCFLTCKGYF